MDRSVRPGDDFFACANGGWVHTSAIPADAAILRLPFFDPARSDAPNCAGIGAVIGHVPPADRARIW
jgi:predicted metalloendopeptidase